MKVTAEAARRFLVARHFLVPARSLAGGLDGVLEVFRRLGSIQFDPIAVAGRSHDLVLHARVAGYEPAWCDLLYERREIFEATNKALSLVLMSEFPWFRLGFGRKGPRFQAALDAYLRFAGADRLEWAPHLTTEKRLFLIRPVTKTSVDTSGARGSTTTPS